MGAKQMEFHALIVEDGVVVGHYYSLVKQHVGPVGSPKLWLPDEPPERAIALMGGNFVLNSVLLDDVEIVDSPESIPGVLIPRPGEDGWQLAPVADVPDWLLAAIGKKEDSGQ